MTLRRAVAGDIAVIRERFEELDPVPTYPLDSDIEELLDNPNMVAIIDDVTGAFGLGVYQAPVGDGGDVSTIVYLLPEAMGRGRTAPLALELLEGLYLIPAAQQKPLIGVFTNGFDARGGEDKGEGKADAWLSMVNDSGRFGTGLTKDAVRNSLGVITGYRVTWILHDLLMRFRSLLRGA